MAKLKQPTTVDRTRYDALLARQAELLTRADELRREVGSGVTTYKTTIAPSGTVTSFGVEEDLRTQAGRNQLQIESPKPKPVPKLRHPGAVELVGDLLSKQPESEINPPDPPPSFAGEARYREITRETEAVTEALLLLSAETEKARKEYSLAVIEQQREGYRAIAESVVAATQVLGNAIQSHYEYLDTLRLAGVEWRRLRPLELSSFGDLAESHTPLRSLIDNAVYQGWVGADKTTNWRLPANIQIFQ